MRNTRLLSLLVTIVAAAACRTAAPDDRLAYLAEPVALEGEPVVSEPLDLAVDVPLPPAGPEVEAGQCVPYDIAREILREQQPYNDALERRAAAANGWRRLTEATVVSVDIAPTPNYRWKGPGEVAQMRDDRIVDTEGGHWLYVRSTTGCSPDTIGYYIDRAGNVFSVDASPQCEGETKFESCGSWPAHGCGVEPDTRQRIYYRVPEDSRLLQRSVELEFESEACYAFEPRSGYDYPPSAP